MKRPAIRHGLPAAAYLLTERHMGHETNFAQSERSLFTSESVTEGHPDKVCDQISDAVLDALLDQDPTSRVACEAATTTGVVLVQGEITTEGYVEIPEIVRG